MPQDKNQAAGVTDRRHILVYMASRLTAAILGFATIAVFTRLATPATFGFYILVVAWAFIFQGLLTRWLSETFFATYEHDDESSFFSAVFWCNAAIYGLVVTVAFLLALVGLIAVDLAIAIAVTTLGLSAFDLAVETTRTKLDANLSSIITVARAFFVLLLGSIALVISEGRMFFVLAVAFAHFLAAAPVAIKYFRLFTAPFNLDVARKMLTYGWPLIIASGTWGVAQNVDRLILAEFHSEDALGAYGALMNFMKQSFFVFGEVVAYSLVSQAKRLHLNGRRADANAVLADAMRSITLIAVFGVVFVFVLQDIILPIVIGPAFQSDAKDLLLLVLLANAVLVLRTYYFGQIVYFLKNSWVSVAASVVQIVSTVIAAFVFIPEMGAAGAAIAFFAGQLTSCILVAFWRSDGFTMPFPLIDILAITVLGILLAALHGIMVQFVGHAIVASVIVGLLICIVALLISLRFDLFAIRDLLKFAQPMRNRGL